MVYVGYNNNIQNLDKVALQPRTHAVPATLQRPVPPTSVDYLNTGKQIFVKVSYLFRF